MEHKSVEFKSKVFNAARDGKLHRLRYFLDHRPKEEVQALVHFKSNGATPLIMACRNGHMNVVEYLIEKCEADLEQVGSVTFDGETIDGAPPIWCAAAAGYLPIVKFLIKAGTEVNKTTFTNSTPLRAACFDGHFEIVQYLVDHSADIEIANRHGHTCLMIACYKGHHKIVKYLLERGANVNRKSLKGNTALHDCAESGSLDIMKLLLEWNAVMDKDSYGLTPLLAAAVTGHTSIVEYLTNRGDTTRQEKIDALELLGATFVDKKRDLQGALKYWREGMAERMADPCHVIEKPAPPVTPVSAYENATEIRTMEELKDIIVDPDDMRMQALLVRERILGPAHPDTSYYIRYRGAVYADMGNFERCITLWSYALDMQQKMLEPLSPMTQSSLLSFAELFSFMMKGNQARPAQAVEFKDMMAIFEKSVKELEFGMAHLGRTPGTTDKDMSHFNRLLVIIMHLLNLLCTLQDAVTEAQRERFRRAAYVLVRMDPRGTKGYTPLHLACCRETSSVGRYPVCTFPSAPLVELLLEVGADIDAVDLDHNTALHVSCANKPPKSDVITLLLSRGAHIDACNVDHKNPMQLVRHMTIYDIVSPLNYMTLQCFAAQKIVQVGIPYKGHIPQKLEKFIRMH